MNIKKVVGLTLLAAPLYLLFGATVWEHGLLPALLVWGTATGVVGIFALGVNMVMD